MARAKSTLLCVAFLFTPLSLRADVMRMDEVEVEGHIQKPEVMFISDRTRRPPDSPGIQRLEQDMLQKIVSEGLEQARQIEESSGSGPMNAR